MSPPMSKKLFRAVMQRMPRWTASFNMGKLVTRTLLRPEKNSTPVTCLLDASISMTLDISEFASNDLFCLGHCYEAVTIKRWCELARNAKTVVDLGSHVGTFALQAASCNSAARIIAVEACRKHLSYLRANTRMFENIEVWPIAVAPTSGNWVLQEDYHSGGGILLGMEAPQPSTVEDAGGLDSSYIVEALSLTDLCQAAQIEKIDLVKIDLEGLEQEIMMGNSEFWDVHSPRDVIVEIRDDRRAPNTTGRLFEAMRRRGYESERIEQLLALPRLRSWSLVNWHFWRRT